MDSGTFESYWFNDSKWNFNRYKKQVENTASDFYTSFDSVPSVEQNYSHEDTESHFELHFSKTKK